MHTRIALLISLIASGASCKSVDCGDGTTENNGVCVPAGVTVGNATCGPFTELRGTQCVPLFPPTVCDPGSTAEDVDGMGVTTCIGTGAGGCGAKLPCPTPAAGKQTICGQIYDFENNQPFAQPDATGVQCAANDTSGPCALAIKSYDAVVFATTGGGELTTGPVYIDTCGRYRIPDVSQPGPPGFIALALDDKMALGPSGVTNPVGVATTALPGQVTRDFETFIVRASTVTSWGSTPALTAGIYAPVYRARSAGTELASGVTFTFGPMTSPPSYPMMTSMGRDYYFQSAATTRTTLDPAANATGMNGTALVMGATLTEVYSGAGGLPSGCLWDVHAAQAIPNAIFIQIFRPMSLPNTTSCTL
jgi:hypothetical protein